MILHNLNTNQMKIACIDSTKNYEEMKLFKNMVFNYFTNAKLIFEEMQWNMPGR